jgi:hypothetical protein
VVLGYLSLGLRTVCIGSLVRSPEVPWQHMYACGQSWSGDLCVGNKEYKSWADYGQRGGFSRLALLRNQRDGHLS